MNTRKQLKENEDIKFSFRGAERTVTSSDNNMVVLYVDIIYNLQYIFLMRKQDLKVEKKFAGHFFAFNVELTEFEIPVGQLVQISSR